MSSTNVGSIHYDLSLDTSKFDQASENLRSKTQSIGGSMASMGLKMTAAVTLPVVAGFAFAIKSASDFNETLNKIDVAFKDQAGSVKEWANTSIKKMGLAKGSALDAAALFGDMSTAMGLNTKQAADMSTGLVRLGADMASFKNVSFERAQTALAGIYTGETEALKGLGIVMTEANLASYAQSQGIKKNIQDMTQAEKVQLRYGYVMSVTTNAQGDFERTSEGTANQIRTFNEMMKELSATMGQKLLPFVNKALGIFQKLIIKFGELSPKVQNAIMIILGLGATIGPLLIGLGMLITAFGILASPVGLVVLGIVAFGSAMGVLQAKFGVLNPLIDILKQIFYFLKPPIMDLINVFKTELLPQLQRLWDMIQPYVIPLLKYLGVILGVVLVVALYAIIVSLKTFIQILSNVVQWINNFIWWNQQAVQAVINFGNGVWNAIRIVSDRIGAFFSGAGSWLYETGKAIIQGLINGVANMAGALGDKVSSIANGVKDKFSSILKIRSPSKVFFGFGENITEGLTQGISKSQAMIGKSVSGMTNMATQPAINPQTNKGGNSNMSIYGDVNIGSKQDADYFFARANRQQDLLSMGLAPIGGV